MYIMAMALRFMAAVLHKLNRAPNGWFSGKELERFVKEDWYPLKGKRLIQRNDRRLKKKRAEAAAFPTSICPQTLVKASPMLSAFVT